MQVIGSLPGQPTAGGDGAISAFAVSVRGRRVADSTDLVPGQASLGLDDSVFVADIDASSTTPVTARRANTGAVVGDVDPFELSLSGDGAFVDFVSDERDFVAEDLKGVNDVFRVDLGCQCLGESICSGALNSAGSRATLCLSGSQVAVVNLLTVTVEDLPPQVFCLLVTSLEPGFLPSPGGSLGDLCINGPSLGRYSGSILSSGATGSASLRIDLTRIPTGHQLIAAVAGTTHGWQRWYRDVVGGAAASNLSEARTVLFR